LFQCLLLLLLESRKFLPTLSALIMKFVVQFAQYHPDRTILGYPGPASMAYELVEEMAEGFTTLRYVYSHW
jgi:hypothetical protein